MTSRSSLMRWSELVRWAESSRPTVWSSVRDVFSGGGEPMFRKLFGWVNMPLTSKETDAAISLVCGGGSAFLAVMGAVAGVWWFSILFAVIAVSQLRLAWRYSRGRDAQPGAAPDPAHRPPGRESENW
jgi:hypothetical protein